MALTKGYKTMNSTVLDKIDDCLDHPENITGEGLQNLVSELITFFEQLRDHLSSPDEKVREQALNEADKMRESLESRAQALCGSIQQDPAMVEALFSDSSKFSSEEWGALLQAKEQLDQYQEQIKQKNETDQVLKIKKTKRLKKIKTQV